MNPLDNNTKQKFLRMFSKKRIEDPEREVEDALAYVNDYSRVVTSAPIRRLKDKAQVFPLEESDYVRTRLTHSLEVAHFGKLLGIEVENLIIRYNLLGLQQEGVPQDEKKIIEEHWIPTILEVVGLLHDIGNPPFGHFGEASVGEFFEKLSELNNQSKLATAFKAMNAEEQADFVHFDGNVQGFRILRHLALAPDLNSYNLTKTVLATIIKYPYSSTEGNKPENEAHYHCEEKFGYFQSEVDCYTVLKNSLGLADHQRHPLTYLLEAADDIANAASDMEDGWKLQYISVDDILKEFKKQGCDQEWINKVEALQDKEIKEQEAGIQGLRIDIQTRMVRECAKVFCENLDQIVNNNYEGEGQDSELIKRSSLKSLNKALKNLVKKTYDAVIATELMGGHIIQSLLNTFLYAVFDERKNLVDDKVDDQGLTTSTLNKKTTSGKLYSLISSNYRKVACSEGELLPPDNYSRFMLVTDYIAGMTDSFAYNLYHKING